MSEVLLSLKSHDVHLTAIVSMADDGQSQAILRDQYHVLPPSDVRKAMIALAEEEAVAKAFDSRFHGGPFDSFTIGSIVIAGLQKSTGSFEKAIEEAGRMLKIKGEVIPVTLDDVRLMAELEDGTVIKGESNIDIPKGERAAIKKVWLEPQAKANPKALKAISKADIIIIGPGDLYTSIIPNFLVNGISEAIKQSKAKKVYLCNLMTKHGETDGYAVGDFVKAIEYYVLLDVVVCNNKKPSPVLLTRYHEAKSDFVEPSTAYLNVDLLADGDLIRHDSSTKLANTILHVLRD